MRLSKVAAHAARALGLVLLALPMSVSLAFAADVTFADEDRAAVVAVLEDSRAALIEEVAGLSPAQLGFRPTADSWSVGEVVEHLAKAEASVLGMITGPLLASEPRSAEEIAKYPHVKDAAIDMAVRNRTTKFEAPPELQPEGAFESSTAAREGFLVLRDKTLAYARSTEDDLRSHFATNPVLGSLDGCQWLLFLAAHTHRHLDQIREIKVSDSFPSS